jgi:hypothetical protein
MHYAKGVCEDYLLLATFRLARSLVVAKLGLLMDCRGNWLGSTQNGERKQWEDQD